MTDITDDLNYLKLIRIRGHCESLGKQLPKKIGRIPVVSVS